MDVTPYLEPKIAPRGVFDKLAERKDRVRFFVPKAEGGWTKVTNAEFAAQIRELALFLEASGLQPGDRAAIFAPNSVAWGAAAMAIQAAGGVMVPIYPASTAEQAGYVLQHSEAKFVFVDGPMLVKRLFALPEACRTVRTMIVLGAPVVGEPGNTPLVPLEDARRRGRELDAKKPGAFEARMHAVPLDQPGLMLYTSGTTGNPKGVPLTHKNVAANGADWFRCNAPLLDEEMVDLLWLPMSHIFGLGELCIGNSLGWTTYLCDPQSALAKMPEVRPHVFMSVPAYWEKLAHQAQGHEDPRARLADVTGGRLRFCLSGGAGLKREVKELFHRAGLLIIEGYGLTETSPTLTLNRPDAFRFDTVGRPLPSVELKLAEDGEILARGANVFGGYHNDPAATREAFTPDGWFKTGDVGRFTEDGFLQIVDRKKDILVTAGGKNVPPVNIETRFCDDPLFAHVLVYGDGKRYLTAGVWVNEKVTDETRSRILARVAEKIDKVNATLASYETIKRFVLFDKSLSVEAGLLTASLKVRRKKVYEAFRDQFESLYESVPAEGKAGCSKAGEKHA